MYKFKKLWIYLRIQKLRNLLNFNKSSKNELTEFERFFVSAWKEKVYDKNTFLYKRRSNMNDYYEIHDNINDIVIILINHTTSVRIDYYGIKNGLLYNQGVQLSRYIGNRLIDSFNNEIEIRCETKSNELKTKFLNNLTI